MRPTLSFSKIKRLDEKFLRCSSGPVTRIYYSWQHINTSEYYNDAGRGAACMHATTLTRKARLVKFSASINVKLVGKINKELPQKPVPHPVKKNIFKHTTTKDTRNC